MAEQLKLYLLFITIILALSFRDMMVNSLPEANAQALKDDVQRNLDPHQNNEMFDEEEQEANYDSNIDNMHDFDDGDESSNSDDFDAPIDQQQQATMKKIPSLKMKGNVQIIKFRFCYSCGYRNMFDQYSVMIAERYPDLKIIGENYAPIAWKLYFVQFISSLKMIVIACIIFGQNPFLYLNMPTPNIFTWATENKLYASLMIFFISNAIETQLITTGAFEIYLNDLQIWSKLQSQRMPHEKELLQMLDMNFNFKPEAVNGFGDNDANFRM